MEKRLPNLKTGLKNLDNKFDNHQLRQELAERVDAELRLGPSYLLLLVTSTLIAVLGLLIDSAAVVIGAMLVAPLFWPIFGISLGLVNTNPKLLGDSAKSLAVSLLTVFMLSVVTTLLTPLNGMTDELAARINPNLLDLIIALVASVVGIVAVYNPRISASVTGVAISLSLMPPLAATGIGVARGSFDIFWGSLLLFSANALAIILAGVVTLWFLHFRPRWKEQQTHFKLSLVLSVSLFLVLSVPLIFYLVKTLHQTKKRSLIGQILAQEVVAMSGKASVAETKIRLHPPIRETQAIVEATVYLPEGERLSDQQKTQITQALAEQTDLSIDLKLNLVTTLSLIRQLDERSRLVSEQAEEYLATRLAEFEQAVAVQKLDANLVKSQSADSASPSELLVVLLSLKQYDQPPLSFDQKQALSAALENKFGLPVELTVEFVPVDRLAEPSEQVEVRKQLVEIVRQDLGQISPDLFLQSLDIEGQQVSLLVLMPRNFNRSRLDFTQLQAKTQKILKTDLQFSVRLIEYKQP